MQADSIIEKAQKLGIDTGSGIRDVDKLRYIAEQVGVEDLSQLEETLDNMLSQENIETHGDNIESLDAPTNEIRNEKFGQKEYDAAKNEDGVYDKNHYKNKQGELDKKLEDAKHEKSLNNKKVGLDENGHNKYKNKNVVDKAKDNFNVAKARQDAITNKLNNAKANAYNMMHPGEALKDKAKSAASNAAKNASKNAARGVANAGKAAGKAIGKGISSAASALIKLAASNPIVLVIIVVVIFILFLLILFSGTASATDSGILGYCNSNCDGLSMKKTSLSKSEFVSKVEEYFASSNESYKKVFADNAGLIYDIAKSENVNPELVVIRAISEGFSPASNCNSNSNNYWGMGCSNGGGCSACITYSSFEDGVRGYVQNISQYDTATDMMSRYAYIGTYWYNPGSSADGGCYYYDYIKEYMSSSRANEVAKICSSNKSCTTSGGSGCTKTTDEDQKAYATWQVQHMVDLRKSVFGLEKDECNTSCYTGDYSINPNDEKYSGLQLLYNNSFESLLSANGMTVENYNQFISKSVEKAGVGTRNGVVAAATTLIGSIAEMGYKLNYQWGGKYTNIGVNPNWGTSADMSYLCSDASYGALYDSSKCYANYKWHSFDCSGFVTWAVINGMQDESITQSQILYSSSTSLNANKAVCKIGGALQSDGHIVLVVGIDDETKNYIVAESTGSNISQNTGGVKISYYSYNAAGYSCLNLDEIYND